MNKWENVHACPFLVIENNFYGLDKCHRENKEEKWLLGIWKLLIIKAEKKIGIHELSKSLSFITSTGYWLNGSHQSASSSSFSDRPGAMRACIAV
jgi:hypothetical protein